MQKLELYNPFYRRYGNQINPDLVSVKYCQSDEKAMVELNFRNKDQSVWIDLDFIGDDFVEDSEGNLFAILPVFFPEADIVDNAQKLLGLDDYSLFFCMDDFFSKSAADAINESYLKNVIEKQDQTSHQ